NKLFFSLWYSLSLCAYHPNFIEFYNKGVELHKTNPTQAINFFTKALEYDPDSIEAHYNVAYLLREAGKFSESLPHYEYILARSPQHAAAHLGRAIINLAFGNYAEGWPEFEWHLGSDSWQDSKILKELIRQNVSLQGKIILLRAEWGAGDTIHMIRYAKLL